MNSQGNSDGQCNTNNVQVNHNANSSLSLPPPPSRVVRQEHNFFGEDAPIQCFASGLNVNNTNSLSSLLLPPSSLPRVVPQEHNFFTETTPTGSLISVLNVHNNTNSSSRLSLLSSSVRPPRVVREERNFFRQTTPTEANQGLRHVRLHNPRPVRANRSVNMIRASPYPVRLSPYLSVQPLDFVRNRTSVTTGSSSMPPRNMFPNSNSNVGVNAITLPLQGQGGTVISQTPSYDFHRRLFNDPAGPSTNSQPTRTPAYEVQFLQGPRRTSGRYTQMLDSEENIDGADLLLEWFGGEHTTEIEPNQRQQNVDELPQGLSEDTIMQHLETFTLLTIDDDISEQDKEKCPVCLEEFKNGNQIGRLHSCEHKYHVHCIKNWLVERNFCPLCKRVGLETNNNENENDKA